jgi:hypothetical protein
VTISWCSENLPNLSRPKPVGSSGLQFASRSLTGRDH